MMLPKAVCRQILWEFYQVDWRLKYHHEFFSEQCHEHRCCYETVKMLCRGYTHQECHNELRKSLIGKLRENLERYQHDTLDEWNNESTISKIQATNLFGSYKAFQRGFNDYKEWVKSGKPTTFKLRREL